MCSFAAQYVTPPKTRGCCMLLEVPQRPHVPHEPRLTVTDRSESEGRERSSVGLHAGVRQSRVAARERPAHGTRVECRKPSPEHEGHHGRRTFIPRVPLRLQIHCSAIAPIHGEGHGRVIVDDASSPVRLPKTHRRAVPQVLVFTALSPAHSMERFGSICRRTHRVPPFRVGSHTQ